MFFLKKLFGWLDKPNSKSENPDLVQFVTQLVGVKPKDIRVYEEAFTHRSAQRKDDKGQNVNFERLEFLGDALLGASAAVHLYNSAPDRQEGYLTKMRSKIVSRRQLNEVSRKLHLTEFLIPANNLANFGEDVNGDLLEAFVGAIYVDQGLLITEKFITRYVIAPYITDLEKLEQRIASHKSLILEWSQKTKNSLRFNTFEEQNAEDIQVFVSVVRLNEKVISKGRGTSKKKAEENAAKRAYYSLQKKIVNHDRYPS
ncbi:ribonuclease III [Weeksella virosa]|uniref:ribonuclease III n=1 Tax=Weeksella virosa TaxID=1014 RepID=UPI0025539717|nr:ribonuclease III [Weeksella virosa]MDK7374069.1 ribonuclease III [Weeksella virosa]